jgi:hypothetical protein
MGRYCICRSLNVRAAQLKNCPLGVNTTVELKNITATSNNNAIQWAVYLLTCGGIVGFSCNVFELNRSINYKWHFFSCASIVFSERCIGHSRQPGRRSRTPS